MTTSPAYDFQMYDYSIESCSRVSLSIYWITFNIYFCIHKKHCINEKYLHQYMGLLNSGIITPPNPEIHRNTQGYSIVVLHSYHIQELLCHSKSLHVHISKSPYSYSREKTHWTQEILNIISRTQTSKQRRTRIPILTEYMLFTFF